MMGTTGTDFFKFSLGVNQNGEKRKWGRKKSVKIPRNSIETLDKVLPMKPRESKLGNIEEESSSCIPSHHNLSKSHLFHSNNSDK